MLLFDERLEVENLSGVIHCIVCYGFALSGTNDALSGGFIKSGGGNGY